MGTCSGRVQNPESACEVCADSPEQAAVAEQVQPRLADYFLQIYDRGAPFEGSSYHRCFDEALQLPVLGQPQTGIAVWSDALDLRPSAPDSPAVLLFHYADAVCFAAATWRGSGPLQVLDMLAAEAHDFGEGVFANAREPVDWPRKEELLFNNHWPRPDDQLKTGPGPPKTLREWGNCRAGPEHPANRWVCTQILASTKKCGKADYCIPLIVPECFVFSLWDRQTPELRAQEVDVGCNKWGEKQWCGRDVSVVQLSAEGRAAMARAGFAPLAALLERRLEMMECLQGPGNVETLCCCSDLAAVLHAMGRYEQAEPLLQRVLEGRRALPAASHRDTQNFKRHIGKVVQGLPKREDAEQRLRSIALSCEEVLGPKHAYSFAALSDLAELLRSTGRQEEARKLLRGAIEREEAASGPDSLAGPHVTAATAQLAGLVHESGQHDEAQGLLKRALERSDRVLGPAHASTVGVRCDLAMLQKAMGRHAEAEATLRQAAADCEEALGPSDAATLDTQTELALFLQGSGGQAEAEALLRRVSSARDATLGPMHPDAVNSLDNLAVFLKAEGRYQEALPLLQQVLRRLEAAATPPASVQSQGNREAEPEGAVPAPQEQRQKQDPEGDLMAAALLS